MPINNNIFGVYKTLKIGGKFVLATNVSRNQTMQVEAKSFIQGTPKTRVLDIGGVREEINLSVPILVGGGARIDGRELFNERIENILSNPEDATLPLLKSASLRISPQNTDLSVVLVSDGDPASEQVFEISPETSEALTDGVITDLLNPVHPNPVIKPTRVAKWYDFRISLAGRTFYITDANIEVMVTIQDTFFIGAKVPETDTNPQAILNVAGGTFHSGTQFPTMGVTGIAMKGSGKAVVALRDINDDGDFNDFSGDQNNDSDESLNLKIGGGSTDLTLQTPGQVIHEDGTFSLQIRRDNTWEELIPSVDLTRSVIEKANFSTDGAGMMTMDFGFTCWVK